MKKLIRLLLIGLRIPITKNIKYDIYTEIIIKDLAKRKRDTNCIDIGSHEGEILDLYLKYFPEGEHIGFEPIPAMNQELIAKYSERNVKIYKFALSDYEGESTFNFVKDAPAYSGLKQRDYKTSTDADSIQKLTVEVKTLDSIVEQYQKPFGFVKIDVEGAEFSVLKGAEKLLRDQKPVIIFEFGLGASNYYNTVPEELYDYLAQFGYKVSVLTDYKKEDKKLSKKQFNDIYKENKEYYFIAI